MTDSATDQIAQITTERGRHYGPPIEHFKTTRGMFEVWENRRDAAIVYDKAHCISTDGEHAARHAVYMILDKLARAATDPMHADDWRDIQGYARCAMDALGIESMGGPA